MTQPSALSPSLRPPVAPAGCLELASVLLGPSAAMMQLWTQIRRLAPHVRCVLLTGEADCGQEAVARVLLELSPQRDRRFVMLTATEAEARLQRATGLHNIPQDAFLYLPDLQQLSLAAQSSILQLLRTRRSRSLTLVAASTESLRALVSVGRLLPELAEALSAVRLTIPSLRQRLEDLPMLFSQLFTVQGARCARPAPELGKAFLQAASQHPWSGNLAELAKVVAALATRSGSELGAEDLAAGVLLAAADREHRCSTQGPAPAVRMVSLETIVQEHIGAVLRGCRGNKLRAAEVLGISRSTLYRMLESVPVAAGPVPLVN